MQFMPADVSGLLGHRLRLWFALAGLKQHEPGAIGVADDGVAAYIRNIFGSVVQSAPLCRDAVDIALDIVDANIARPTGCHARRSCLLADVHHPAYRGGPH